jgi:hypothetical protein
MKMENLMKLKKVSVYFLIVSLLFAFGCNPKEEVVISEPDYLIPEDTFKMLLFDLYLLEGYAARNPERLKKMDTLYERKTMYIFEKHQVKEARFRKSFDYYLTQPQDLERMYEELLEEYTTKQANLSTAVDSSKKR